MKTIKILNKAIRRKIIRSSREIAKLLAFRYTKFGVPTYRYSIEPIQLATLVTEIDRLKEVKGNIVEVGVARGMTTRFVCQHIANRNLGETLLYYAIDTFESFKSADLDYEVKERGKSLFGLQGFGYNDYKVWQKNFAAFRFVKAIKTDCAVFDYNKIKPIKISFLDVDLYLPTKKTLPKIYDATVKGGVILVDDVLDNMHYDGAYQAYMEFVAELNIKPLIIGNKCGVIYKN